MLQDFTKLSDRAVAEFLLSVGMPQNIIEELFRLLKKKISPQPKGYITTDAVTRILMANSFSHEQLIENLVDKAKMGVMSALINSTNPVPWYWLSEDLGIDLIETDFPEYIPKQLVLPNCALIIFPKGLVTTTTGEINFVVYKIFAPEERAEIDIVVHDQQENTNQKAHLSTSFIDCQGQKLVWAAMENADYVYGGVYDLAPEENSYEIIAKEKIFLENQELEDNETKKIGSLLINTLVYASQNMREETVTTVQNPKKSKKKKIKNELYSQPLFIGENYISRNKKEYKDSVGKGAKKSLHWRRGFWRSQAYGENYSKRKWVFIAPTLVGIQNNS